MTTTMTGAMTMTEQPTTPGHRPDDAAATAAAAALRARAANTRSRPRRRHPAQGARIAAVGIGATTMAGLVGFMGYAHTASATPNPPNQVAVITNGGGATSDGGATAVSTRTSANDTTLTARPTVLQAPPADQAPAASTSGSG